MLQTPPSADQVADLRAEVAPLPAEVTAAIDAAAAAGRLRAACSDRHPTVDQSLDQFGDEVTRLISSLQLGHEADMATSEGRQVIALDAVLRTDEVISPSRRTS